MKSKYWKENPVGPSRLTFKKKRKVMAVRTSQRKGPEGQTHNFHPFFSSLTCDLLTNLESHAYGREEGWKVVS